MNIIMLHALQLGSSHVYKEKRAALFRHDHCRVVEQIVETTAFIL